jgi:hypothetical protein
VRRPSDRQTNRRSTGGDPREICNQVPGHEARAFLILGVSPARQTAQAKAPAEEAGERTLTCVSLTRRTATPAWVEMAGGL